MKHTVSASIFVFASSVSAGTLSIEVDDSALFIRCVDMFGSAQCDMVFEDNAKYYDCIAITAEGKPIATGIGNGGNVTFPALDAAAVTDVKCR